MKNLKKNLSEAEEQAMLIKWAESCVEFNIYPELDLLFAVPNGGRRDKAEAAHLKAQGVKAGVPDLCLPVPKGRYNGLFIEMKVEPNKTTDNQNLWLKKLNKYGNAVAVCYGFAAAKKAIEHYLSLR